MKTQNNKQPVSIFNAIGGRKLAKKHKTEVISASEPLRKSYRIKKLTQKTIEAKNIHEKQPVKCTKPNGAKKRSISV